MAELKPEISVLSRRYYISWPTLRRSMGEVIASSSQLKQSRPSKQWESRKT